SPGAARGRSVPSLDNPSPAPSRGRATQVSRRPGRSPEGEGLSMRRIALANLKGGSGKTTTATALAVGLAARGRRTLVVDPAPSATGSWTRLGGQGADAPTLAAVLPRDASAAEAVRPTPTKKLDLLPADASLGAVNVALAQQLGRDVRLRAALGAV